MIKKLTKIVDTQITALFITSIYMDLITIRNIMYLQLQY